MKKIGKLLVLFVMLCSVGVTYGTMVPEIEAPKKAAGALINIKIKFGRPKHDCAKFGICEFTLEIKGLELFRAEKNIAIATASINESGNLVLQFEKNNMMLETITTYFDRVFIMDEDFEVPQDVLAELNWYDSYIIKTGEYYVQDRGNVIVVEL